MARSPINIQAEEPMFAEGEPADDLRVENIGDDVLIGDPAEDMVQEDTDFDQNLAEVIDERELSKKADELIQHYENDKSASSDRDWETY